MHTGTSLYSDVNYFTLFQNLHHPGVVNLEQMYETPEKVNVEDNVSTK